MKQFIPIRKEDAIKKVAEFAKSYESYLQYIGIFFETRKEGIAFLEEVKKLLNKVDFTIWNKSSIVKYKNGKRVLGIYVYNANTSYSYYIPAYTLNQLYGDSKCLEKYKDKVIENFLNSQEALNPDNVENFCIIDTSNLQGEVKEHTEEIIDFIDRNKQYL